MAYYFVKPVAGWTGLVTETEKVPFNDGSLRFVAFDGNTLVAGSDGLNYALVFVRHLLIKFQNLGDLLKKFFNSGSTIPVDFQLLAEDGSPISDREGEALATNCAVQVFLSGERSAGCPIYDPKDRVFHLKLKTSRGMAGSTYRIAVGLFEDGRLTESSSLDVKIR